MSFLPPHVVDVMTAVTQSDLQLTSGLINLLYKQII